jgi:general secretion pathway protein F
MPVFAYKGINAQGKNVKGVIDAGTASEARSRLKSEKIYVTDIDESAKVSAASGANRSITGKGKVNTQDLSLMTQQLSTLLSSGIPLVDSVSALIEQTENTRLKETLSDIRSRVNEGSGLGDSMSRHPKVFNNLYVNMIRAGEASGTLDQVLEKLTFFTENQNKLQGKITSALAYPIFMIIAGIIALVVIFTVVIPKLTALYEDLGQTLPLPTQMLIGMSDFLQHYWYLLLIVLIAVIVGFRAYVRSPTGKRKFHQYLLTMPLFGPLFRMIAIARFSNTLSTLLSSGVPILTSMDIVKKVIDNVILKEVIEKVRTNLSEGDSIAEPLRRSGQFPPLVTHMISVGEKSGELESMLYKVSETYDNQVENKVATLTALMEPVMILVMTVVIGFIVFSVMLPLINMNNSFG